ncbi:MAG: hypothetical protein NC308_09170 [Clostridium sp.]|nr:hypothetical protein [Bacteroides sp.]MCM1199046.1 hypothetical protein [Clostridium sp.]
MKKMSGKYLSFISSSIIVLCILLCNGCCTIRTYAYSVILENETGETILLTEINAPTGYPDEITLAPGENYEYYTYSRSDEDAVDCLSLIPLNLIVKTGGSNIEMRWDSDMKWNVCNAEFYTKSTRERHSTYRFTFTDEIVEELLAGIQE